MDRKPIYYSKEFYSKQFHAGTMKKAYMDACKWYSTFVLSKDNLHGVQVEYTKGYKDQIPTVTMRLFVVMEENELREHYCAVCREAHTMFYMSSATPCNKCEANAYQRHADERIRIKLDYYTSLLAKAIKDAGTGVEE